VLLALAARATTREAQRTLSDEGLEIARRTGDEDTLQTALASWHDANRDPEALDARLTVAQALLDAAVARGDVERRARAQLRLARDRFEAGEIAAAAALLDAVRAAASDVRLPSLISAVSATRAAVALLAGRHEEADQLVENAHAEGVRGLVPGVAHVHLVQLWALRREQARYDEMADAALRLGSLGGPASLARAMAALASAELGRSEEARRQLDAARRDVIDGRGWARLPEVAMMAEASWLIGDRELAGALYDALIRWRDRHVVVGDATCSLGAAGRYLGQLAALDGRYDEADAHFGAAHTLHERLAAPGWLARGQFDHARVLLQRARPGDADRAHQLIAAATRTHRRLGQPDRADRAEHLQGAAPSPSSEHQADRGTFRLEGEYWAIEYRGARARVRDSKGLRYLARLLSRPGQEVHALDLVAGPGRATGAGPAAARAAGVDPRQGGDAGALLDAKAKAAYKRRLDELREDIADAEAANDLGRLHRAQEEMDFLVAELAAAVGLGGRDRKGASDAERARQSVTRAIKAAIERVAEADPVLGDHLRTTVRTGTYSSYGPDPRAPIEWVT
jgi:tetratricopeptide (TPR) repeat protein